MITVHHLDWMKAQETSAELFRGVIAEADPVVVGALWTLGCYEPVAVCRTDDLSTAYIVTNTIRAHWSENEIAWALVGGDHRSTSIGDILFTLAGPWICRPVGFAPIMLAGLDAVLRSANDA